MRAVLLVALLIIVPLELLERDLVLSQVPSLVEAIQVVRFQLFRLDNQLLLQIRLLGVRGFIVESLKERRLLIILSVMLQVFMVEREIYLGQLAFIEESRPSLHHELHVLGLVNVRPILIVVKSHF